MGLSTLSYVISSQTFSPTWTGSGDLFSKDPAKCLKRDWAYGYGQRFVLALQHRQSYSRYGLSFFLPGWIHLSWPSKLLTD